MAGATVSSRAPARVVRPRRGGEAPLPSDVARTVRLKRGDQPTHSPLTPFQQWAWRTFKSRVQERPTDPLLEENLVKAHMRIRGDEYLAVVYAQTLVAGIALLAVGIVLGAILALTGSVVGGAVVAVLIPVGGTVPIFFGLRAFPSSKAKARGRAVDRKISIAMNFMSAMASADVNIDQIFHELARQKIYGEVAEEAAWITRDTELLGVDILTAIKEGAIRSPSKRFQDFLQGVVTTATSGGQLKPYFLVKADQYERENKLDSLQRTETMGLFAEIFVIGVVAFPLFLIIILAIFAIIGGNGGFVLTLLWLIVGLVIPVVEGVFIFVMYVLSQEA